MESTAYQVKTGVFEGPLDVLLRMVEERKLMINEISLAQVTDDYLAYVRAFEAEKGDLPAGRQEKMMDITGFLFVAATLLLIKSKSLLPNLQLSFEEQGQVRDLEVRLRMYQAAKQAGLAINDLYGSKIIFSRPESKFSEPIFTPAPSITKENLLEVLKGVLENLPKKTFLPEVNVKKVVSIEEMINSLVKRVEDGLKFSFADISKSGEAGTAKEKKVYAIVSFLALLELVRQGILAVAQNNNFEDIQIEKQSQAQTI
jgi:segregation and condensation protein A